MKCFSARESLDSNGFFAINLRTFFPETQAQNFYITINILLFKETLNYRKVKIKIQWMMDTKTYFTKGSTFLITGFWCWEKTTSEKVVTRINAWRHSLHAHSLRYKWLQCYGMWMTCGCALFIFLLKSQPKHRFIHCLLK